MDHGEPNHLVAETSPYLQQHVYNLVDWYPWSDEAFELAKKENKPVFLSIGYSTCHWCHVMAHESFEDEEVAALLNEHFVSIKVDREERPDIDRIYMKVAQMMTGTGGWPLSIFMTPDKKPFFAATYIPKRSSHGRHGLLSLLPALAEIWETQQDQIAETLRTVQKGLERRPVASESSLHENILTVAKDQYLLAFDSINGGFGTRPKFPAPHNLMLLLRLWNMDEDRKVLSMVEKTLKSMRMGGIFDHVGYGFHRYSTDAEWRLPHFEKMLYDQAMHIMAYTEAYQATGRQEYAQVVREIIEYVRRSLRSPEGGFYSAEDADSEGEEGRFYVWTLEELEELLAPDEFEIVKVVFNVNVDGNFEDEATGRRTGANVLYMKRDLSAIAWDLEIDREQIENVLACVREKLLERRSQRTRPLCDVKVLADWNGLMVAALAKAGVIDDQYLGLAEDAMALVKKRMIKSGRLAHGITGNRLLNPSYLDDYAFVVWGLIELYQATAKPQYLLDAHTLNSQMLALFHDETSGALFFTAHDSEELLGRDLTAYDGAIPSGNSVAAMNIARLARITGDESLEAKSWGIMSAFTQSIERNPMAYSMMLMSYQFLTGPTTEVVITGPSDTTRAMAHWLRVWFLPNMTLLLMSSDEESRVLDQLTSFTNEYTIGDQAMAYICVNKTCNLPTGDLDDIKSQLSPRPV
ncbi:MAG: thioredoxin domain-containing protein [Candidatus Thorarchaeota archaeon]|nr:thioredoxin domain-containing protein [Candidatus Thorarchaeota archaeon]